jgi:hypothetical protein
MKTTLMKKIPAVSLLLVLLGTIALFAQHDQPHTVMHRHSAAKIVVLNEATAAVLAVRLGAVTLPAHADHRAVAQPQDQFFDIPFAGWLTAYHPRLTDDHGTTLPGVMLHHVAVYNTRRSDFLCPSHEEHIFGAGGEMKDWEAVPGFGYRVHPQDRIRVSAMFHNPTSTHYPQVYLEVKINYQLGQEAAVKSVYPAWFDVKPCGNSNYDLSPGKNVTSASIEIGCSGILLGVGGHMHDYGRQLVFENVTRHQEIAVLNSQVDPQGHLLSIPVALFLDHGGYHLEKGDIIKVTAIYENTSGRELPLSAMGIVVGYFLPDNDVQMSQLTTRAP